MPINYNRYPPDWQERRTRILLRAGDKCEVCGASNHQPHPETTKNVVLTIAHLDWNETDWTVTDDRLQAMCQRCHLAYDRNDNRLRRRNGKYYKDVQQTLF
jgi:hypothetical protein